MVVTTETPVSGSTQRMFTHDENENSSKLFSLTIKKLAEDIHLEVLGTKMYTNMIEAHHSHGFSKIMFGTTDKANAFVKAILQKYGTTFSIKRSSELFVTIQYRVKETPSKEFMEKYGELFEKIKDYTHPTSGEPLPVKEFPTNMVVSQKAEPERRLTSLGVRSTNGNGVAKADAGASGNGVSTLVKPASSAVSAQPVVNSLVKGFEPLSDEQKSLFAAKHIKAKHRVLYTAFESVVGEFGKLPALTIKKPGALIYLSLEKKKRDVLAAYLDAIGIRYELGASDKTIILFGNVPVNADDTLMQLINKSIEPKTEKVVVQKSDANGTHANEPFISSPVEGFVPLTDEQKTLFTGLYPKMRSKILLEIFKEKAGMLKNFPALSLKRPEVLMYLSLERRDDLAKYLDCIGIRYEFLKSKKTIALFGNIPFQADAELMELINNAINSKVAKEKKNIQQVQQPVVSTTPAVVEKQPKELAQVLESLAAVLKGVEKIPEKLEAFDVLMKRFDVGIANLDMLDDLVNLRLKAVIEQKAKQIALLIAKHATDGHDHIMFMKGNLNTFSEAEFALQIEEGLKEFIRTCVLSKKE